MSNPNTAEEIRHNEFELDDAASEYAEDRPDGWSHSGSFKDGALWMIQHIRAQEHTAQTLDRLKEKVAAFNEGGAYTQGNDTPTNRRGKR